MASESKDAKGETVTVQSAIEHAKRAFALKKYEQAVAHYASALELLTKEKGDDAPETADLYFAYGKALLENAISQSTVLGKEQPEEGDTDEAPGPSANGSGPILSFSGDAEDYVLPEGEDVPVDLAAVGAEEEDEDEIEAEPEDDFNAAWEVLDLARAIYERQNELEPDDEVRLKLADTYIALGDVSLETEKFDVAVTDYEAGLDLKTDLLPISSRQIAEAHYKLSMVLDLTPGRLAEAIMHAEKALESVNARLVELRSGLEAQLPGSSGKKDVKKEEKGDDVLVKKEEKAEEGVVNKEAKDVGGEKEDKGKEVEVKKEKDVEEKGEESQVKKDVKGKGKAPVTRLIRDDLVQDMTKAQIDAEIKELEGLREDLGVKVEELKTTPNEAQPSAPALAAQELERELNAGIAKVQLPVNDLTSIVKKKKKADTKVEEGAGKRKAGDERAASPPEKKVKLEAKKT